jgi:hypothetical protein
MLKVEIPRRSSLSVGALAMLVVCAIVWWASADSDAQEATPAASRMTADSTSWSLEKLTSNSAPHLMTGMAGRAPYSPLRNAGEEEVANPCASIAICKQAGPAASGNRTDNGGCRELLLASVSEPTTGVHGLTDFPVKHTPWRQTIQISPERVGTKSYYLVDDASASGPFLYGHQMSKQLLKENESVTGNWHLPVLLFLFSAATAGSQSR